MAIPEKHVDRDGEISQYTNDFVFGDLGHYVIRHIFGSFFSNLRRNEIAMQQALPESVTGFSGGETMAGINIGPLRSDDLLDAGRLMYRSRNYFRKTAGLEPYAVRLRRPVPLMRHIYGQEPALSWGAYDGTKLAGFLISHLRDRQWHAAWFFVDPSYHRRGIGRALLQTGLGEADVRNMYFLSSYTFAYNLPAIGLFSSFGLFPRKNNLRMIRPREGEWALPRRSTTVTMTPIKSIDTVTELNRMDGEVRGINRAADHCYWLANDIYTGYIFKVAGRIIGYAYIADDGSIGPVLATRDMHLVDILVHCLYEAQASKCDQVSVWVNGKNFGSQQVLLANKFVLREIGVLVTNRVFCDMRRYLPHSPIVY